MTTLLCIQQRRQRIFYLLYLNWRAPLPDFSSFSWGHVTYRSHKGDRSIPTHLHQQLSGHLCSQSWCTKTAQLLLPVGLHLPSFPRGPPHPWGAISLYIWTGFHRKACSFVLPPTLPPLNLKASCTKHPPLLMTSLPPSQWCWASSSAWSSLSHQKLSAP